VPYPHLVFIKKVLAVLKAFGIVIFRTIPLEPDKVFASSSYTTVRKDLVNLILRFPSTISGSGGGLARPYEQ
jgi:hypothetical protein